MRANRCKLLPAFLALASSALLLPASGAAADPLPWPPKLPGGAAFVRDASPQLLEVPKGVQLTPGVVVAKAAPEVEFHYYPGQDYPAKLWSAWGENLAVGPYCYSAIGDHDGPVGNAFLYQYDARDQQLRKVVDLKQVLQVPEGKYTPGKIHSRIDQGNDGWLYFSTHRGSTRVTLPKFGFAGGWILRHDPQREVTEVVAHAPLPNQTLPTSVMDPQRMIFYAGTQDGANQQDPMFLAYDVKRRKVLYSGPQGPARCLILARSTGRVYFHPVNGKAAKGPQQLYRFDPAAPAAPVAIDAKLAMRAATMESPEGDVYTIEGEDLWAFNTRTEQARHLGKAPVAGKTYTASLDLCPRTYRYLYYIPGAHGGAEADGTPVVQYDLRTNQRKVLAFLHPYYHQKYDYVPSGAYGLAISPEGDKLYITFNGARRAEDLSRRVRWNTCAFFVLRIPAAERLP